MNKNSSGRRSLQPRDKWVHFVMSQDELDRMQQKMEELGIRNKSSYLRKMALDGYCVNLELDDVKEMVSLLRYCSNNLNQYAKRATRTAPSMRKISEISSYGRMKSGKLQKKFWRDWQRSSNKPVWQVDATPST